MRVGMVGSEFFTLSPLGRGWGEGAWLSSQIQQPVISVGAFA